MRHIQLSARYGAHCVYKLAFGLIIERGRAIVEQIQNIVSAKRARYGYALTLSARQIFTVGGYLAVKSFAFQKLARLRSFERPNFALGSDRLVGYAQVAVERSA